MFPRNISAFFVEKKHSSEACLGSDEGEMWNKQFILRYSLEVFVVVAICASLDVRLATRVLFIQFKRFKTQHHHETSTACAILQ